MAFRRDDLTRMKDTPSWQFGVPIDIGSQSYPITANWAPAQGATKAEVTQGTAVLNPSSVIETQTDTPVQSPDGGSSWVIDIPKDKRVSAITLHGFKQPDQSELVSQSDLPGGMRISVAFPAQQGSGYDSPRFAVPPLDGHDHIPPTLAGASYSNRVLKLGTAVEATKALVSLVSGDNPAEFSSTTTQLDTADVTTESPARNAKLVDPNGTAIWQTPVFEPNGPAATVDFRAPLQAALNKRLAQQQPPQVTLSLSADPPAQVFINSSGPSGMLLRLEKGVIRTKLEGDPLPLQLSAPLASEKPVSVTANITVRYQAIRILEEVFNSLPNPGDSIQGMIVGTDGAVRALPPQGLDQRKPVRVGLYGRAPEDCELSIEFVRMAGSQVGASLAAPMVLQLKKNDTVASCWADVPKGTQVSGATGLRVRANRGRFFWVSNPDGNGIARIAIVDPDPGGRPLVIGGAQTLAVSSTTINQPAFSFAADLFDGTPPVFLSNLFLVIECADLALRYAR